MRPQKVFFDQPDYDKVLFFFADRGFRIKELQKESPKELDMSGFWNGTFYTFKVQFSSIDFCVEAADFIYDLLVEIKTKFGDWTPKDKWISMSYYSNRFDWSGLSLEYLAQSYIERSKKEVTPERLLTLFPPMASIGGDSIIKRMIEMLYYVTVLESKLKNERIWSTALHNTRLAITKSGQKYSILPIIFEYANESEYYHVKRESNILESYLRTV
jgi:hypothetical protein